MKYVGSKNRHAKELLSVILPWRCEGQYWVEPFVGGANILDKVQNPRMGNDAHFYLIEFLKELQGGWLPPTEITEELYKDIQKNKDKYPSYLVGYVGFNLSFGGKWFGGYCRDKMGKRNYGREAYNNIKKQQPNLIGVDFYNKDYRELEIPHNSIIYCDPPYKGTTKYKDEIDYIAFWEWCRQKQKEGHKVFISEYQAPEDFECVWSKEVFSSLDLNTGGKRNIEKLFIYKG